MNELRSGAGATVLAILPGEIDPKGESSATMASLCVRQSTGAGDTESVVFLLTWHFPSRPSWAVKEASRQCNCNGARYTCEIVGSNDCTRFPCAWAAVEHVANDLVSIEADAATFLNAIPQSDLAAAVKEGALVNLSTLRSQTVFRTPDGRLYGFEACGDGAGCRFGSCVHVRKHENPTAFLFGDLARTMREVEFIQAPTESGFVSYRVTLPVEEARSSPRAPAHGQVGSVMECYRERQLSGDRSELREVWPGVRASLQSCWIEVGWDADKDGVMERCRHSTVDVECHGPNPQMQGWYLGGLRTAEEMARAVGDDHFAAR